MAIKKILELDGGGIRGVIPAVICSELESYMGKKIYEMFDLISGTSTGAILGSQLAAGVSGQACKDLYVKQGAIVFDARTKFLPWNWFREKYDRKLVLNAMSNSFLNNSEIKKSNPLMSELKTKFMCTSVSIVDEQTHFFKSWEPKDGKLEVLTAVARSFAAAYYFGAINDPDGKQVWADGGEGLDNCTVRQCIIESYLQDWVKDGIYILSLGCGHTKPGMPYEKAAKMGWVKEAKFYMGLAERQSISDQIFETQQLKVKIDRLDIQIPEAWHELDAVKYIPDFQQEVLKILPDKIADVVINLKKQ